MWLVNKGSQPPRRKRSSSGKWYPDPAQSSGDAQGAWKISRGVPFLRAAGWAGDRPRALFILLQVCSLSTLTPDPPPRPTWREERGGSSATQVYVSAAQV